MNYQETFDFVMAKLHEQGGPSVISVRDAEDDGNLCRYRGENGRKCAVGHLISDEEACVGGEVMIEILNNRLGNKWNPEELEFLTGLQELHDKHPDTMVNTFRAYLVGSKMYKEDYNDLFKSFLDKYSLKDSRPEVSWLRV